MLCREIEALEQERDRYKLTLQAIAVLANTVPIGRAVSLAEKSLGGWSLPPEVVKLISREDK